MKNDRIRHSASQPFENALFLDVFVCPNQIQSRELVAVKLDPSLTLRAMLAAAFHRDLEISAAEDRIILSGVDPQHWFGIIAESLLDVKFPYLPNRTGVGALCGVGCRLHRDRRNVTGVLVLTVAIRGCAGETGDHD